MSGSGGCFPEDAAYVLRVLDLAERYMRTSGSSTWMHQLGQVIQRDLLVAIKGDGPVSGQEVAAELEKKYSEKISNARLYENLDNLCTQKLVKKNTETGGRHNEYTVTPRGCREIADYFGWYEGNMRD